MNTETRICPYWQKFSTYRDWTLAICGTDSPVEEPDSFLTEAGKNLKRCPLKEYQKLEYYWAYECPAILEINNVSRKKTDYLVRAGDIGRRGIDNLEQIWDQEVDKFIDRHS